MKVRAEQMTVYSNLLVSACPAARGNRHGYTSSDYAIDAAAAINRRLGDQGLSSWPTDAVDAAEQERAARRAAEREIAECDEMFRECLTITIEHMEAPE
jgi:hypothetical protein